MAGFEQWVADVRRHTLTEAHGPEEAERLMAHFQFLTPTPPEARHPGSLATRIDSDNQLWPGRDDSLPFLRQRRDADGATQRPRTDEERARDAGLPIEAWRRLAR